MNFHSTSRAQQIRTIVAAMLTVLLLASPTHAVTTVNFTVIQSGYTIDNGNGGQVIVNFGQGNQNACNNTAPNNGFGPKGNTNWSCYYEAYPPAEGTYTTFQAAISAGGNYGDASSAPVTLLLLPNQTVNLTFYVSYTGGLDQAPPSQPSADVVADSNDGVPRIGKTDSSDCVGMATWQVSEPYISLWLQDEPLGYQPALGPRISCLLSYKQRENYSGLVSSRFSIGRKWNFAWLSFLTTDAYFFSGNLYFPNGGSRYFSMNGNYPPDYLTGAEIKGNPTIGFTYSPPGGGSDLYGLIVSNETSMVAAYLTERRDAQGRKTRLIYDPVIGPNGVVRLRYVIDGDGRTNTISYVTTNNFSTNLISQITDPFGRTASFFYDAAGHLTNIVDVAGISSSFTYVGDDVATLTTPYGTTSFTTTEASNPATSASGRSVLITGPDGSRQLYFYKDNAPGVTNQYWSPTPPYYPTNEVPNTAPFENGFERYYTDIRNSFHWGARQYAALSTTNMAAFTANDFRKARRRHWAFSGNGISAETLFLECEPSPSLSGETEGQKRWFDTSRVPVTFGGSTYFHPLALPANEALVLPGGISRYTHYFRNAAGAVTNEVSTYSSNGSTLLRTNIYVYSTNKIDLLAATNALGIQVVSNIFNAYHQILTNYNALNEPTIFTYNTNRQLTFVRSPSGLTTTNIYFATGSYSNWLAQTIDLEIARTNAFTYTNGMVRTHTDPRGLTLTHEYDALQRLTKLTFPDNTFITHTYARLDLIRTVDRLGFTNTFGYDALRRRTAETNALGHYTLYDYCTCGALNSIRDAAGNYTTFYRDNLGRATNTVYADGYSVANYYNLPGQLVRVTDSAGASVTNWFNVQGLPVASSNAFGRVSTAFYDPLDRITNSAAANGVTTITTYDALNRPLTRSFPDGGGESFGYSANITSPTRYTNQLGNNVVNYTYDPAGRKTSEVYPGLTTNQFTYSSAGDLLTLTDGKNQVTTWRYDSFGRQTNKVDAANNEIFRFAYDANDRLTNRWTAAKGNTTYRYDALGNLTNIVYPVSPTITLQYDALRRLTNLVDAVGTSKFTYDAASHLLSEDGPWSDDTVSHTYANRLRTGLSLQQPSGTWTNGYQYDLAQRLTNVTSQAGSFGYRYPTPNFQLPSAITLPGGSSITNTYDNNSRLLTTTLKKNDGTPLNAHAYGYNFASQRTTATNYAGDYQNYTYDLAGQLKAATGYEPNGAARLHERFGYAYDPAGNLNHRTNHALVQTFAVNNLNELVTATRNGTLTVAGTTTSPATNVTVNTSNAVVYADTTFAATNFTLANGNNTFTAIAKDALGRVNTNTITANLPATNSYAYDLNGNLLTNGNQVLIYDDENQLVTNYVAASWKSEFVYDGLSRRRIQRDYSWNGSAWVKTNELRFVWDGNVPLQHRDSNNMPLLTLTRGIDLSGRFQGAGGIGGLLALTESSGVSSFYHTDGNGNVTALVNANQIVVGRASYGPFGEFIYRHGAKAEVNPYWFSSQYLCNARYLYLRRVYAPDLQRWLNQDPIGEAGGLNLHAFVGNNPVNAVDPLGESDFNSWFTVTAPPGTFFYNPAFRVDVRQLTGSISVNANFAQIAAAYDNRSRDTLSAPRFVSQYNDVMLGMGSPMAGTPLGDAIFRDFALTLATSVAAEAMYPSRVLTRCASAETGTLRLGASETWGNASTLERHFADHGADFGATSAENYANQASQFFQRSQAQGLPTKIDASGVIRVYDPAANTFGAFNPNGTTRTFFTPAPRSPLNPRGYNPNQYSSPLDYWNKQ